MRLLCAALLVLMLAPMSALAEPPLAPHRAEYTIHLQKTRIGEISRVEGQMLIVLTRDCEAWSLRNELRAIMAQGDGTGIELDVRSTSREALDGTWLEFETITRINGAVQERREGRAELTEGRGGRAEFVAPEAAATVLGADTEFPIAASRRSLAAIFSDDATITNYVIFDGSQSAPMRATDIVAGTPDPLPEALRDDPLLSGLASRRIVTSFHDMAQTDSEPVMTYVADGTANGIITRLTIDLDFIVTEAVLTHVTAMPGPHAC